MEGYVINYWVWLSLTAIAIFFEVITGANFFLLWLGVCAAALGILTWFIPGIPWEAQFCIYAALSTVCLALWQKYIKNNPIKSDKPLLNRKTQQFIGKSYTLESDIINGRGKIRVGDTLWLVTGPDLKKGESVVVTGIENGSLLVVEKR